MKVYGSILFTSLKSISSFAFSHVARRQLATSSTMLSPRQGFGHRSDPAAGYFPLTSAIRSRTGLFMIFEKFFGGGAYASNQIDYANLDEPGPELGRLALDTMSPASPPSRPNLQFATFAGGCFWGLELAYQRVAGVEYTAVGYTQGRSDETTPTYTQVSSGNTDHTEAVLVYYDPQLCSYEELLDVFFGRVDPLQSNGQGMDRGRQYRTGVYFHSPGQEQVAKARFEKEQKKHKRKIASECLSAKPFWPAEKYHQQYLEKGGRFNQPQDARKGATEQIRCYG